MNNLNFLKLKKDSFAPKNILRVCSDIWDRFSNLFFLLFSLSILSWGVYFWFQMMYRSDWNADQKKQYQNSQSEEVELKEKQLKRVIGEIDRKKGNYDMLIKASRDIFSTYFIEDRAEEDVSQGEKALPNSTSTNNASENPVRSIP